ncbi:MAG: magnesium-translocating P-type ATPase [Coprobacillus sp.]|nr:magnesium-translocating P-type ATPase [Coprobacillus sp.]
MSEKKQKVNKKLAQERAAKRRENDVILGRAARAPIEDLYEQYHTSYHGLTEDQVDENREQYGSNKVSKEKQKSAFRRLLSAFADPFTIILFVLLIVSCITDMILPSFSLWGTTPDDFDYLTAIIIAVMILASALLRFVQESRSGNATAKLLDMITTTCAITRIGDGKKEIPLDDVVVGDIVSLSNGDMIPADCRVIEAKDLYISQAPLTGESEPIEKTPDQEKGRKSISDYGNIVLMGSNVLSGSAKAIVIATGDNTLFGTMAKDVSGDSVETSFTKGVNAVSWLLIRFMLVMVPVVFLINGFTKWDWISAFLFAISIAVGLTPEMLPMIVTTCLAKGGVAMSRKKTIVKNLNSIQNFGAMDILCTDKTGTLTQDQIILQYHMNVHGEEDTRVLRHAYLNSYFQTGYKNLMDLAIIRKTEEMEAKDHSLVDLSENYTKVDEIPFDFVRRRLTTVVMDKNGKTQMVTKGAMEEMLSICSYAEYNGVIEPLTKELKSEVHKTCDRLSEQGFRVLCLAQKSDPKPIGVFDEEEEEDMVLLGFLAFLDPPKETSKEAIAALRAHGVTTKILTGDNEKVTKTVCAQVGLEVRNMLKGNQIAKMSDAELAKRVETTQVFAKLTPDQKARIVTCLRDNGHIVGFMGDGINDAAAMKSSDIGISVDNAVDIAKESADIILLEKDLMVLENGVVEGRKTYGNMIKYIKLTASSNFGNALSVLVASAFLPFLPMMSIQILLLNLIYDLCCTSIPWDNMDKEFLEKPRTWDASTVGSFMLWFGPVSSIFDFLTFLMMYFVFCPIFVSDGHLYNELASFYTGETLASMETQYMMMFQAGWFVLSMWTQSLVIHMIRSPKIPFIQSRASSAVTIATLLGVGLCTAIPFIPGLNSAFGFVSLPGMFFVYLIPCVILYMCLAQLIKKAYIKRYGELL